MKLFLIRYDRPRGQGEILEAYPCEARGTAVARLRELELHKEPHIEVVILEADSEEAIRKTHGRYFKTLRELALG